MNSVPESPETFLPAGRLVLARIANLVVGLGSIPLLVHFLGGDGFAAWAVLLATGVLFTLAELGVPLTFVKSAAPLIASGRRADLQVLRRRVIGLLLASYGLGAILVFVFASRLAGLLNLSEGLGLGGADLLREVYACVAVRSCLQLGALTLSASGRFDEFAEASFAQSLASNGAAVVGAALSRQVDVAVHAYWLTQLVVTGAYAFRHLSRAESGQGTATSVPSTGALLWHGLRVQTGDLAQVVTYQFDKFLLAAYMGLGSVPVYEVANRSVQALRSLPSSSLDSMLVHASIGREAGRDQWPRYLSATRFAMAAVLVFLIAPLSIAAPFLFAWTGELGHASRFIFGFLLLGAVFGVLAIPAASLAQASGRAELQAKCSLLTVALNIALSLSLVTVFGGEGAAAGSAMALGIGSLALVKMVHDAFDKSFKDTWRLIAGSWPLLLACLAYALALYLPFEFWLDRASPAVRASIGVRACLGFLSGAGYCGCVAMLALMQLRRERARPEEERLLGHWIAQAALLRVFRRRRSI